MTTAGMPGGGVHARTGGPAAGRSVTSRVLSVLSAFSGERRRMSLSDISRRTQMPLTTAHRLVSELVSWGALERDRDGRYQIGLHLWEVAALAPRGLGLLAYAPPEVQERYLAGPLAAFTSRTITDPARLRSVLAEVRRAGYVISDRQVTLDAVSVAAPVRDASDEVTAALSVVVRHGDDPLPGALVPVVVTTARGLSRWLRSHPGRP
ncbi:IclR family transcriptional regulator C-terminal domain-containing protein [Nonomuraea sp. NPDC050643]|uniref:IclR family transcriptional regulator n=1 Tax=Nonomuraea sp. NPDC050643 TaxID=3155660 RepID=UPI0033E44E6C